MASPAVAQARPVRIVVPFAPGGGADLIARLLQPHLQPLLGQSFYVENRAGAAGRIGTDAVAKAEPDGHTLLMTTEAVARHRATYRRADELRPAQGFRASVIAHAQCGDPGGASVGTGQDPAGLHRARSRQTGRAVLCVVRSRRTEPSPAEIFKQMTGLNIVHVPYQGTGAAIPAVIANQVGAMWGFLAGLIPHIRSGSLRALSVGGKERSPALPDVPTVAEAGVPGYEAASWIGLLAPAATPRPIVERLWEASAQGDATPGRHRHPAARWIGHRREQARGLRTR